MYGPDQERRLSTYKVAGTVQETRYYGDDGYEKYTDNTDTARQVHYIMGGDGICAAVFRTGGSDAVYYLYKDHLGPLLALTNPTGVIMAKQSFDAWDRRRNPADWTYTSIPPVSLWLKIMGRGYTGHEHHDAFG